MRQADKRNVHYSESQNMTPLHKASYIGDIDMLSALITEQQDINLCDKNGNTPLMEAVKKGHRDIVELLLKYGAKPDQKNLNGYTALFFAFENAFIEIAELLIIYKAEIHYVNTKSGETMMHAAALSGSRKAIGFLIEKRVSATQTNTKNEPPIFYAINNHAKAKINDRVDAVRLLLEYEQDSNLGFFDRYNLLDLPIALREIVGKRQRSVIENNFQMIGSPYNFLSRLTDGNYFSEISYSLPHYSRSQHIFAYLSLASLIDCKITAEDIFDFTNNNITYDEISALEELYHYLARSRVKIAQYSNNNFAPYLHNKKLHYKLLSHSYVFSDDPDRKPKAKTDYDSFIDDAYYCPSNFKRESYTRLHSPRYAKYYSALDSKLLYLLQITEMLNCVEPDDQKILIGRYDAKEKKHYMGCYHKIDIKDPNYPYIFNAAQRVDMVTAYAAKKALITDNKDEALKYAFLYCLLRGYNLRSTIGACWAQEMSLRWIFAIKGWEQFRKQSGIFLDLAATSDKYSSVQELINLQIESYKRSITNQTSTPATQNEIFFDAPDRTLADFEYYLLVSENYHMDDLKKLIFYKYENQSAFQIAAFLGNIDFFESVSFILEQDQNLLTKAQQEVFSSLNWAAIIKIAERYKNPEFIDILETFRVNFITSKRHENHPEDEQTKKIKLDIATESRFTEAEIIRSNSGNTELAKGV